jgi:acetoin utilization deacetylase AcuC-like enzyme
VSVGLAYSDAFLRHETGPRHPERPDRLRAIVAQLRSSGVWDRLSVWEPEPCDVATLELVHTREHIENIRRIAARGGGRIDADTVASEGSWDAALRAGGALVEAVDSVSRSEFDSAYCVVRPPGHHATPNQAMGFCLFNNVAIAAQWLIANGRAKKVAILDYDVHHGNGTQDAFADRSDVLYVSTHQFPLYPGTGHWRETGVGTTVNIALPPGSGDAVYGAALERVVEPVYRRFAPDFTLVSLGFDAFFADPLANMRLSLTGYARLIRAAIQLSNNRVVVALEGGYDLDALAHGSEMVCHLLLGEELPADPLGPALEQLPELQVEVYLDAIGTLHHIDR